MAMESKKIVRKSGLYLLGNLSSKVLSSLLLPIYAIYVSVADLGTYDMIHTICSMLVPIVFCCIWEAALRYVLKETDESIKTEYISTIVFFTVIEIIFIIIIAVLVKLILNIDYEYYTVFIVYILVFGCAQIFQAIARAIKYNNVYVFSGIIATVINFVGVLVFVCFRNRGATGLLEAAILGQVSIIVVVIYTTKLWNFLNFKKFNYKLLRKMLLFSIPLILNQIVAWLVMSFSKVIINAQIGLEANGLYSFATKFSVLVTMVGNVVAMALFEEAILVSESEIFEEKYSNAVKNLNRFFFVIITIFFPIIVIFYNLFANSEYILSKFMVPFLLIYSILMNFSTNLGSVFQVIDKTQYQFITTTFGAIVSCSFSYILVFKFGMYGVIVGQLLGAIAMLGSRYFFLRKYLRLSVGFKQFSLMTVLFFIVVIVSINQTVKMNFIIFIFVCILTIVFNKDFLQVYSEKIEKKLQRNNSLSVLINRVEVVKKEREK